MELDINQLNNMDTVCAAIFKVRGELAEIHSGIRQGMEWYKKEMDDLKAQLSAKDKEIEDLKKQLNEKSTQ